MTTPQRLVDTALDLATLPCVAVATERTEANLRWAANALTTNGEMRSLTLMVTVTAPVEGGTAAGTVSRELADESEVAALIAAAERIARSSPAAEDAAEPVGGQPADADWSAEPETTRIEELATVATDLGRAFTRAAEAGELLFGFAELVVTTDYLGSSTGLRRRGVQRSGRFEFNGKAADGSASAWVGRPSRDFTDIDVTALHAELTTRLGWARTRVDLPPGRYETLLPPGAVADLMIYLYWTAGARDAEEGRNVFSAGEGKTRIGEQLSPRPLRLWSDPTHPGLETVPFVTSPAGEDGPALTFDLGQPISATDWISDGVLRRPDPQPGSGGPHRAAADPAAGQPADGRGRDRLARADGRLDRARTAVDLLVVHPRGRSRTPAADRSDP